MADQASTVQFFSSQFRRQQGADGKYCYWFDSIFNGVSPAFRIEFPFEVLGKEYRVVSPPSKQEVFNSPPEELQNPSIWKLVYMQWLKDCSGAFVKSPTLESCIAKTQSLVQTNAVLPKTPTEELSDTFQYCWYPVQIRFTLSQVQIYWAPATTTQKSRIELEEEDSSTDSASGAAAIDIQNPEKTYTFVPQQSRTGDEWIQELADLHVPYADGAPLRLQSGADQDVQKEKFRRRVREARLRAKLARYRAERMALRFEERYGFYPEEDVEEAQTEVESDSDE